MKSVFMMRAEPSGPVLRCFILEGLATEAVREEIVEAATLVGLSTEFLVVAECVGLSDVFQELSNLAR